jgi:hypothetical protein
MASVMEQAEEQYPKLVNCLGHFDLDDVAEECYECKYIYHCHKTKRELESIEFAPGKYRQGFGKLRRNPKYG